MTVTVSVVDDPAVRVTEEDVVTVPPDTIEFAVEGTASVSRDRLAAFEGRRLRPVAVGLTANDSAVTLDLGEEATLRLDSLDVGIRTPEADDLRATADRLEPSTEGLAAPTDATGEVAFAVEGTVTDVAPDTFEALSGVRLAVESVTFAVEDPLASDGGSGEDVVLEVSLFGFGILIYRDGTVTIGTG